MKQFLSLNLIMLVVSVIAGCGGDSDNGNKVNGLFSEIGALSVSCDGSDGGPAACNNSQQGKPVLIGWTSNSCGSIDWSNLAAMELSSLFCISGQCSVHDSTSWKSSSGSEVYSIGSANRTAVAWLNLVDHGVNDDSDPQTGDVVCCKVMPAQHADIYADIYSDKCSLVP